MAPDPLRQKIKQEVVALYNQYNAEP